MPEILDEADNNDRHVFSRQIPHPRGFEDLAAWAASRRRCRYTRPPA